MVFKLLSIVSELPYPFKIRNTISELMYLQK